jgi:hypothetical protein
MFVVPAFAVTSPVTAAAPRTRGISFLQIAVMPKATLADRALSQYKSGRQSEISMGNREMRMVRQMATAHKFLLAAAYAGTMVSFAVLAPSTAQARDYPYCIKGDFYASGTGDCSFDTYQQCLATASGRRAYCDVNPFYRFPEDGPAAYRDTRWNFRR